MLKAAIIGAGPGGCAAALAIARLRPGQAGSVAVFEAKAFPRVKACGEFVSPAATDALERLISPDALVGAGARRVDRLVLEFGESGREWRLPAPAWVLSRRLLDAALLERVRSAGVRIEQPARVVGVEYADDRVAIHLADGRTELAETVIHADGSGRHDPAGPIASRRGVIGMKCHFRPPAPIAALRMRACRGAYVGTVQVEAGEATCALVAAKGVVARHRGDGDSLLAELWPAYRSEWRTSDWLTCGVGASGYRRPGHARSFRVGNAAAAVEPIGGEGIGLALWSGLRLGELLASGADPVAAERTLAREYRARLALRRSACRAAAEVLMRPGLAGVVWPLLGFPGLTVAPWYRLTGKPPRRGVTAGASSSRPHRPPASCPSGCRNG